MDVGTAIFGLVISFSVINLYHLLKKTNEHLKRIEDLLTRLSDSDK